LLILVLLAVLLALLGIYVLGANRAEERSGPLETSTPRSQGIGSVAWAKLYIVVDNRAGKGLEPAWGLSIFVKTPAANILFDTGPDDYLLGLNAHKLGIDPCNVSAIVISHEHLDHIGGLAYIAQHCPDKPVYIPRGFSPNTLDALRGMGLHNIIVVNETTEIAPGILILGPLHGPPWEQSLAINVASQGLVLLVGCSHPGVTNIARKAVEETHRPIALVIGGFHLFGAPEPVCKQIADTLVKLGVKYVAPIHCSGDTIRNVLRTYYPQHYIDAKAGTTVYITEKGIQVEHFGK
jgi:7,8-dihydropterin-6-yl-methyl-4-(beta-D-ribofuranosyl)aminobenzene 5'-phosphate synthase